MRGVDHSGRAFGAWEKRMTSCTPLSRQSSHEANLHPSIVPCTPIFRRKKKLLVLRAVESFPPWRRFTRGKLQKENETKRQAQRLSFHSSILIPENPVSSTAVVASVSEYLNTCPPS